MNRIAWLVVILVLGLAACSSPDFNSNPQLGTQFGTAEEDVGVDVATISTGRIYALSTEAGPYAGGGNAEVDTYQRFVLQRFDGSGNKVWSKELSNYICYGYAFEDCATGQAVSLSLDTGGNIYALRTQTQTYYNGYDPTFTSYTVDKFDAAGRFIRSVRVAGHITGCCDTNYLPPSGRVTVDNSGNFYFTGTNCSTVYEDDLYAIGGDCVYVVSKHSYTGALLWQRTSTTGAGAGIFLSSGGSLYVAGSAGLARYDTNGNLKWTKAVGPLENVVVSGSNIYTRYRLDIRKFDANGTQLWLKKQSGLSSMVLQDISGDTSGNVYLSGKYAASSSNRNPFVRKLNSSGSTLWTKTYGTTAYDDALGIATITGSEIYVTGETQGSLSHTNIGGRDGYLRKLNSSGNLVWSK